MTKPNPVILLVNGPNLDQLGKRDPAQYGSFTLADVEAAFAAKCAELGVEPRFFQSGCEGELCHAIHEARDYAAGIVINAGAYTHYSYALQDAIALTRLPVMEVHVSDIHSREPFRRVSVLRPVCVGQICGLGLRSYTEGLEKLVREHVLAEKPRDADAEPGGAPPLETVRREISLCTADLVKTLQRRLDLSLGVVQAKSASGKAVFDPGRERIVVEAARELVRPDCADAAAALVAAAMRLSRERQYDAILAAEGGRFYDEAGLPRKADGSLGWIKRVAFAGAAGSYGARAAAALFPGAEAVAEASFAAACERVAGGAADAAVLPLANTTGGPVDTVYKLLRHELHVVRAFDLGVKHCLAAVPGATLGQVRAVRSHPQALAQCSRMIRERGWAAEQSENTAFAAAEVAKRGDPSVAAVCSPEAAAASGLEVLCDDVCDTAVNTTRFVAVARELVVTPDAGRLGLLMALPHKTGSLASALAVLADRGLNLRSICAQPVPERPWEYAFFIDIDAPALAPGAVSAVYQLRRELPDLRVIGWYGGVD